MCHMKTLSVHIRMCFMSSETISAVWKVQYVCAQWFLQRLLEQNTQLLVFYWSKRLVHPAFP